MLKLVDFLWCSMKMRNINKLLLTKVCLQNLVILCIVRTWEFLKKKSNSILHGRGKKISDNGYLHILRIHMWKARHSSEIRGTLKGWNVELNLFRDRIFFFFCFINIKKVVLKWKQPQDDKRDASMAQKYLLVHSVLKWKKKINKLHINHILCPLFGTKNA